MTVFLILALSPTSYAAPKYGPPATRLYHSRDFVKKHPAPDFWSLFPYYIAQQDARSCSVAAAAMILNGARAKRNLDASEELITQKGLLARVNLASWNQGVGDGGRGIALDEYGPLLEASFKSYGFKNPIILTRHADGGSEFRKDLLEELLENEKSADGFIIANYLQSEFTGDPEGAVGHYAPVAAFDSKSKKVLILDPDRQYYEPYWVSLETFIKGMNTLDSGQKKSRGYLLIKPGK
ncbi:MAG: hypothetical protein KGP28_10705 [Bdellovibrionales bacterium]|nr:hypothetical protein [Bdellovibrionales bacterium]